MLPAHDYKRLLNGDIGPNTGGLGAYCPSAVLSEDQLKFIQDDIIQKVLNSLYDRGVIFKGSI